MLSLPNVLLIGATGRNVGKTEYAVRLCARLAADGPVAAVKITVIKAGGEGRCPRGGQGCGVCSSLGERPFILQQDDCPGSGKDTHRLRAAGAQPVWWLRVREQELAAGLVALAAELDPAVPVVAESNSARHGLEPGLFLIIQDSGGAVKASCQRVLPYADVLARRIGDGWDVGVERPRFAAGRWSLPEDAGAILLAGGQSSRMGQDKALLPWNGQPLIAHIAARLRRFSDHLLIGANDRERFAFLSAPVVPDRERDQGPLRALASCLAACDQERHLLVGCDMPQLSLPAARALLARCDDTADAVVPRSPDGRPEPLFAIYHRRCLPVAEAVLAAGGRRFGELLAEVRVRWVEAAELPGQGWARNLNTPADYQQALAEQAVS
jgi:molybdopterin-guanine dinucleotide biosynthesis protein A